MQQAQRIVKFVKQGNTETKAVPEETARNVQRVAISKMIQMR
jgi:hypothetical protein